MKVLVKSLSGRSLFLIILEVTAALLTRLIARLAIKVAIAPAKIAVPPIPVNKSDSCPCRASSVSVELFALSCLTCGICLVIKLMP